jgi:hypothetical protein
MDLSSIAQDLYSVPPDEFIEARRESVAAARAAGDAELSKAIGALRKPSAAAAAINLLARNSEELLQEVVDLGEELRAAQEQGDGGRLRALNEERKALLRRVAAEGAELAEEHGLSYGPAVSSGVDETIKAALADPRAAEAVQAGLLVTALSGAGLGFIDLADSVALPNFELKPRESQPKERRLKVVPDLPDARTARIDAAREALTDATELAEAAEAALEESEAARDTNESARTVLHKRLDALKQELKDLQAEASAADDAVRDLDRAVVQATKARDAARKELTRAQERLGRLS